MMSIPKGKNRCGKNESNLDDQRNALTMRRTTLSTLVTKNSLHAEKRCDENKEKCFSLDPKASEGKN